ncbi:MAG: SDR family NAD(P)-dependent oxidoreductase [Alphaproteobacteria bacterium]|nr:SDR family NAD(P)-dependent oxidoreductase [Alphaproteobacteria bacterium]
MTTQPRAILISGASSGLGAAVAEAYSDPGVTLFLGGRDRNRLETVAATCRAAGAAVHTEIVDVTDIEAMRRWVVGSDANRPLDLVIANAGISGGTSGLSGAEPEEQVRRLFDVNLGGVMNTVLPIIPTLSERGHGQIAMFASLAGYRGIPGAPAYCASKAAVKVFGEGLTGTLHGLGVGVSVICPGYVRTPMTDANAFPMPFLMEAERAARIIKRGLAKRKARIAFPWPMATAVWLLQALSPGLIEPVLRRLPKK